MLCTDTQGSMPAIHLSQDAVEIAAELDAFRTMLQHLGIEEGFITFKFQGKFIPTIEFNFRKFRKKKVIN